MYPHISEVTRFVGHRNQDKAFNGSFPIKERSELGPQSFKKLRSTNVAASTNLGSSRPIPAIRIQRSKNEDPILHHTLPIIHPSITIRANLQPNAPAHHPQPPRRLQHTDTQISIQKNPAIPASMRQHRRTVPTYLSSSKSLWQPTPKA